MITNKRWLVEPWLQEVTEMEVHQEAALRLKMMFPIVRSCIPYKTGEKTKVVPDISVFNADGVLLFCIEVKDTTGHKSTNQRDRYEAGTGVKCYLLAGLVNMEKILKRVEKYKS